METFKLPFRLGKIQLRAVLDAEGHEVVVFPKGREELAKEYVDFKNKEFYINILSQNVNTLSETINSINNSFQLSGFSIMGKKVINGYVPNDKTKEFIKELPKEIKIKQTIYTLETIDIYNKNFFTAYYV